MTADAGMPWSPILDILDVGVIVQDLNGVVSAANPKAFELLGVTHEELIGRSTRHGGWDVIDLDGNRVEGRGHPSLEVLATGTAVRDVVLGVHRPRRGDRVWLVVSAVPDLGPDGRMHRVVVTFADVDVVQRGARDSESRWQAVIRSMSEGVVVHEPSGAIRMANAAAEAILGLSSDQMAGRVPLDSRWRLVRPDGEPAGPEDIPSEITRTTGRPCRQVTLGVHRPDGSLAWLQVSTDPIRDADGALTGIVATFADVTEERATRQALELSRAQVQRVLDAVPGVVYQFIRPTSGPDRLPFLGGRIRDVLGFDPAQVTGELAPLFTRVHPDDLHKLLEATDAAVAEERVFEQELRFQHPDGSWRWLKVHSVPTRMPEGVLFTGVVLDVTESKRMAEALRRRQRREAMADLAAGIAHNFNNMLAVILPNLELAIGHADEAGRALLQDAEQAARRAGDLVEQMLALGREGGEESTGSTADLVPLVREAAHICRSTFDRGIAIRDRVEVPCAHVHGRPSQLQQVLLNLCLNARDALDGLPDRRLELALTDGGDGTVLLTVSDNGHGMSEETLRRLGEPFFTTKRAGAGTGLGLASAFRTIADAGGHWTVASAEGAGTTFVVRFPLVEPAGDSEGQGAARPDAVEHGHLLVVDDEPLVRRALARLLARSGFVVSEAGSGEEALAQLGAQPGAQPGADPDTEPRGPHDGDAERGRDSRVDAVLLDLSMPGMSGTQLLQALRTAHPGLPVIVMSGHVPDSVPLAGAAAVLQKPVPHDELVATVGMVLMAARQAARGTPGAPRDARAPDAP